MSRDLDAGAIGDLYDLNWARVPEWQGFLQRLERIAGPNFEWRAERPPAPSPLSLSALRNYIEAIEEDFRVFTYELEEIEEDDRGFRVTARLEAESRAAREPFDPEVTHVWVVEDGAVSAVELAQ